MTPLSTENFPYTVGYVMELLSLDERELTSLVRSLEISPQRDDETGRTIFTHKDIEQLKKAVDMQKHGDSLDTIARHFNPKVMSASTQRESADPMAWQGEEQSDLSAPPKPRSSGTPSLTTPPPQASPEISPTLTSQSEPVRKPRSADRVDLPPLQVSNPSSSASPASQNRAQPGQKPQSATPARPVLSVAHSSTPTPSASHDSITVMIEAVSQVKEGILKDLSRLLDDKLAGLDEVVVELIRCKSENDSLKKKLNEAIENREILQEELSRFKPVQFGFYKKT